MNVGDDAALLAERILLVERELRCAQIAIEVSGSLADEERARWTRAVKSREFERLLELRGTSVAVEAEDEMSWGDDENDYNEPPAGEDSSGFEPARGWDD